MMLRKECFECWAILLNAEGSLHDAAAVTMEATFRTLYRPVVKDPKTLCPMCLSLLYIIYWQLVCQLTVDRNQWAPSPPPFFFFFWLLYDYVLLLQQCTNVHNTYITFKDVRKLTLKDIVCPVDSVKTSAWLFH